MTCESLAQGLQVLLALGVLAAVPVLSWFERQRTAQWPLAGLTPPSTRSRSSPSEANGDEPPALRLVSPTSSTR